MLSNARYMLQLDTTSTIRYEYQANNPTAVPSRPGQTIRSAAGQLGPSDSYAFCPGPARSRRKAAPASVENRSLFSGLRHLTLWTSPLMRTSHGMARHLLCPGCVASAVLKCFVARPPCGSLSVALRCTVVMRRVVCAHSLTLTHTRQLRCAPHQTVVCAHRSAILSCCVSSFYAAALLS